MEERKKVLMVDDKKILQSFKNILELESYNVDTAETGREAADKSKYKFFHLALLDIRLPDMNGVELLSVP